MVIRIEKNIELAKMIGNMIVQIVLSYEIVLNSSLFICQRTVKLYLIVNT